MATEEKIDGISYLVEGGHKVPIRPTMENRAMEALAFLINARDLFFGLAEDGIGIPPYIYKDLSSYITDRKEAIEWALAGRKRMFEKYNKEGPEAARELAAAKYVGAMMEKIGWLAEEAVILHKERPDENETEKGARMQQYRENLQGCMLLYQECQKHMYMVKLKGNKESQDFNSVLGGVVHDINKILGGPAGDAFKAALQPNEVISRAEAGIKVSTITDISTIALWMDKILSKSKKPGLNGLRQLVREYCDKVIERVKLDREDFRLDEDGLPIRDHMDVKIAIPGSAIMKAQDHPDIRSPGMGDLRRGTELIHKMIKNRENPVSVLFLFSIRNARKILSRARKMTTGNPAFNELYTCIIDMEVAAEEHLKYAFNNGLYREDREKSFKEGLNLFLTTVNGVNIPEIMKADDQEKFAKLKLALVVVHGLLARLAPDLSQTGQIAIWAKQHGMGMIRARTAELTRETERFINDSNVFLGHLRG